MYITRGSPIKRIQVTKKENNYANY